MHGIAAGASNRDAGRWADEMRTQITMALLSGMLLMAGCNYAYPPAIRNGTEVTIRVQCTLDKGRQFDLPLTPGNTFWTTKDRDTQVLELRVDGKRYDLSRVEQQSQNKVMFLVRPEGVVVLHMAELPDRWYELKSEQLAKHGKAVLKAE